MIILLRKMKFLIYFIMGYSVLLGASYMIVLVVFSGEELLDKLKNY